MDQLISSSDAIGGAVAAFLIAQTARAVGALTRGGMLAATVVGAATAAAGWAWAAMLMLFFVSSTLLSRAGRNSKRIRAGGRVAKTGARDSAQVLANGGLFAAGAITFRVYPHATVAAAALGALAAATSDTWATEVGMLSREVPRSVVTREPVLAGTSGGITHVGTLAGFAGALVVALAATVLNIAPGTAGAVALGGVAGLVTDSVLGATLQAQRRCPRCDEITEAAVHSCGTTTEHHRGWRRLDNDGVNLLATLAGAGVAAACRAVMNLA